MKFSTGDKVKWSSQAGGFWKEKIGQVVEVVPARETPKNPPRGSGLLGRREESYVVKAGGALYWPLAGKLRSSK